MYPREPPEKDVHLAMLAQTLYNERKLGVNAIVEELLISEMKLYKYFISPLYMALVLAVSNHSNDLIF